MPQRRVRLPAALVALIALIVTAYACAGPTSTVEPSATVQATEPPATPATHATHATPATPATTSATPVPTPAATPASDSNPSACSEPDLVWHETLRELVLVNCATGEQSVPLTLWSWNGERWRELPGSGALPARVLGGAAYDSARDRIVTYGGFDIGNFECDTSTWEWDGATWTEQQVSPPPNCHHFRMTYDTAGERALIFGGQLEDGAPIHDTFAWDGVEWTLVTSEGPLTRAHFGFVNDPNHDQTLMYGGYDGSVHGDFWALHGSDWEEIDLPGPGPRSHFGMAYDTAANALYMYGGAKTSSSFSSLTDETWVLTGGAWQQIETSASPGARGSAALAFDPDRQRLVLYGGFNSDGSELSDTWEFDGQDWSCLAGC